MNQGSKQQIHQSWKSKANKHMRNVEHHRSSRKSNQCKTICHASSTRLAKRQMKGHTVSWEGVTWGRGESLGAGDGRYMVRNDVECSLACDRCLRNKHSFVTVILLPGQDSSGRILDFIDTCRSGIFEMLLKKQLFQEDTSANISILRAL